MPGARNRRRMDEEAVGPRQRVAGGPVGYKHGMRDGNRWRGKSRETAPGEWETGCGDWAREGMRRTETGSRKAIRN